MKRTFQNKIVIEMKLTFNIWDFYYLILSKRKNSARK